MIPSPEAIEAAVRAAQEAYWDEKSPSHMRFDEAIKAAITAAAPYHFEEAAKVADAQAERWLKAAEGFRDDGLLKNAGSCLAYNQVATEIALAIRALARPET